MARFDQHYPAHFQEGLAPFAVCEQWYFARRLPHRNWTEDITEHLAQKVAAACAHRTMLANLLNQCAMLLSAWDGPVPEAVHEALGMDPLLLMQASLTQQAAAIAQGAGLAPDRLAEVFRVVRFGDPASIFEACGFDTLGGVPQ